MKPEFLPSRLSVWRRLRLSRAGLTIALIVSLVLGGTSAYAYWAVTASLTTSPSAGSLEVSTVWSTPVGKTFTNESYTVTGAITVKNNTITSTQSATLMPYTLNFTLPSASADPNPLKSALVLKAWKILPTATCGAAPASPTYTGTWGGLLAQPLSSSLRPSASDIWCVETSVDERSKLGAPGGTASLTPSVSARLSLTGTNWTANSSSQGATQQTQAIFPQQNAPSGTKQIVAANGFCLDVTRSGGNGIKDVEVVQYLCGWSTNQQWNVTGVTGTANDSAYVRIKPVAPANRNLSSANAGLTVRQSSVPALAQQWQLQERTPGVFQIVNRNTGKCISTPNNTSGEQLTFASCDAASAAQQFRLLPGPTTLSCKDTNPNTYNEYSWSPASTEPLTFSIDYSTFREPIPVGTSTFRVYEKNESSTPKFTASTGRYPALITETSTQQLLYVGEVVVSGAAGIWLNCR